MSLDAPLAYIIPDETARVPHATFATGNPYLCIRDTLGPIFTNPDFADLFAGATCAACPARPSCVGTAQGPQSLLMHERAHYEALHDARTRQQTDTFKAVYAGRAGIEGSISQGVRVSDLRHARYIGYAKTRLMQFLVAAALNLMRVAAWLSEVPHARMRISAFARLAPGTT